MTTHIQQRKKPTKRAFTGLVGRPLDEAPPDPFADRIPLPPLFPGEDERKAKEAERKAREAERGRERRKARREQLAAIKDALKTPVREINRRAEELARALKSEHSDMNRGSFITDAPTSQGRLRYSQNIEQVAAAADRAAALGAQIYDPETGELFWPDHDRRRVEPEGTGERGNGERSNNEQSTVSNGTSTKLASGVPTAKRRFVVKLSKDLDREQALLNLFHRLSADGVCRLCYKDFSSESDLKFHEHLEEAHGDESEPEHDPRFGDVITPEVKRIKKGRGRVRAGGRASPPA